MKVTYDARYPGLNEAQFRSLIADHDYQDALAVHAKLTRREVKTTRLGGALRTDWISTVHRSLDQVYLKPLKAIWPHGLNVEWREVHEYRGARGSMRLELQNPSQVEVAGEEQLFRQDTGLVRHIEIDMGQVKLPLCLRFLPGIKAAIGSEVRKGLERADAATEKWLHDHPGRYAAPKPEDVLDFVD
jgi:hypothetical protein